MTEIQALEHLTKLKDYVLEKHPEYEALIGKCGSLWLRLSVNEKHISLYAIDFEEYHKNSGDYYLSSGYWFEGLKGFKLMREAVEFIQNRINEEEEHK